LGYIGNTPAEKFQTLEKQSFSVSATTGYTLSHAVTSPQDIALFINNVRQNPNSSYSVSGTSLTLSAATASGDTMYCVFLGKSVGTVAPALSSVTRKMLASPWQSVQTSSFTAVAGYAYMCNTTSSAFTVTLPGSASVGDVVQIVDYAGTFATNNITLTSSLKIEGGTLNKLLKTNREGVTITFVDTTQGWVATSGVNEGSQSLEPLPYSTDFLVIAGGGAGGRSNPGWGGAGGAGGYRNSFNSETSGGGGSSESSLTFNSGITYTITVGAGGTKGVVSAGSAGTNGANSSISGSDITDIISIGGGRGSDDQNSGGVSGGSGGGGGQSQSGASGTSNQGFAGGNGDTGAGGGGGGASEVGSNGVSSPSRVGGDGGDGLASAITGSSVTRGGGGGGVGNATGGSAGAGGGGAGRNIWSRK
jgi:hypothetical protein